MTRKKHETNDADLATEAARIEARNALDDSDAVASAALSDVAPVLTDAEISGEIPAFEAPPPPPWIPSTELLPQWVIAAKRLAWKIDEIPSKDARTEEPRARWTSIDIDYCYYKGGHVLATFNPASKHGAVFGVLKVDPIAEFDKDPEPAPAPTT